MINEDKLFLLIDDYISLKREFRDYKEKTTDLMLKQTAVIESQFAVIDEIQKKVDDMTAFMMPVKTDEPHQEH